MGKKGSQWVTKDSMRLGNILERVSWGAEEAGLHSEVFSVKDKLIYTPGHPIALYF